MQFTAKLAIALGKFFTNFYCIVLEYSEKYTADISYNRELSQSRIEIEIKLISVMNSAILCAIASINFLQI